MYRPRLFWIFYYLFRSKKKKKSKSYDELEKEYVDRINREVEKALRAKTINQIDNAFSKIKEYLDILLSRKPWYVASINTMLGELDNNTSIITLRDAYIKEFVHRRINRELNKMKILKYPKMKEKMLNKALNIALEALNYIPEDMDIIGEIARIEDMYLEIYEEKEG